MFARVRRSLWDFRLRFKWEGQSARILRELEAVQWKSPEEVQRIQRANVESLLRHAFRNVPYYSEILREARAVDDEGNVNLDRFTDIPLLDKATIRQNFDRLQAHAGASRKRIYNTSGGSTGEPVRLVQDATYKDWGIAIKTLMDRWTGYEIGDPKVVLWGSERDLFVGREPANVRIGRLIRNEKWFNTFRMTPERMREYVREINRIRPVQVLAYVESMYELSRLVEREGLQVYSPRAIMTSAGTLQPHMRETIERVFRAPVFNRYGSREVGNVAVDCDHRQGLHVISPAFLVEVLRDDGTPAPPGEVGEVVVTLLTNRVMPLIRYRIGDMASWATGMCSCGRGFPRLERVVGRTNSMIRTKNGTFDSVAISTLLYYKDANKTQVFDSFSKYRFIQKAEDRMVLLVVVHDDELWESEKRVIENKMRHTFGDGVTVDIVEVEDIPPAASGKFAYVVSEIGS